LCILGDFWSYLLRISWRDRYFTARSAGGVTNARLFFLQGIRPFAAEGHEADDLGLRRNAGSRPVAAKGHEADRTKYLEHQGGRPVPAQGHESDKFGLLQ